MVKDRDQRANLLQIVDHHWKQLSTFEKAKLVKFREKKTYLVKHQDFDCFYFIKIARIDMTVVFRFKFR